MPMRQTIGISLACLMISTGAIADSTESAGGPADAYLGPVSAVGKSEIFQGRAEVSFLLSRPLGRRKLLAWRLCTLALTWAAMLLAFYLPMFEAISGVQGRGA